MRLSWSAPFVLPRLGRALRKTGPVFPLDFLYVTNPHDASGGGEGQSVDSCRRPFGPSIPGAEIGANPPSTLPRR